ncbi:MAG: B12-binding domain-containing radical SAM protein, partial [Deltaproteobacteria bacterium]
MKILLIRPDPGNERFGLGPFFRMEPLGLEYVAQALIAAGHEPLIVDLRFGRGLKYWMRKHRPALVGISCMHALEYDQVVELATQVRRLSPSVFLLVGGHAAAVYPKPLEIEAIDALCLDDGEEVAPALAQALAAGRSPASVPALRIRTPDGFVNTEPRGERTCLDLVPLPARGLVERYRRRYHCLIFKPAWVIETSRGCPYRCSFCSVWQLNERTFRERSVAAVVDDFAACGPHVFVADDLFWYHPARSREIARALKRRGVRKRWLLVQSRCDLVASQPELLEEWRDVAQDFDIFFGMESASDDGLEGVAKDAPVEATVKAIELARAHRYGVV